MFQEAIIQAFRAYEDQIIDNVVSIWLILEQVNLCEQTNLMYHTEDMIWIM